MKCVLQVLTFLALQPNAYYSIPIAMKQMLLIPKLLTDMHSKSRPIVSYGIKEEKKSHLKVIFAL